jgi:hypothetical protein
MINRARSHLVPFGQTLVLTLFFLLLFIIVGEITVRQKSVQSFLKTPTLNGRHLHFERQWNRLEQLAREGMQVECIALGNSMVLNSFDPQVFNQSFFKHAGEEITCFNFGVDALTPVSASALATILVQEYRPKLLIFGTDARDFAVGLESDETRVISDMAWVRYRLGRFNLEGWLLDHAYLYRYRRTVAGALNLSLQNYSENLANAFGYEPFEDTKFEVTIPPSKDDSSFHIQYYYRVLGSYSIKPENVTALSEILSLNGPNTTVIVVEMPVPETYFTFFGDPTNDYAQFTETLQAAAQEHGVLYFETTHLNLIPDDAWVDYSHVNIRGAEIFSQWLGSQLGTAYQRGKVILQNH